MPKYSNAMAQAARWVPLWAEYVKTLETERDLLLSRQTELAKALGFIAELEGDHENQRFRLTRFQAAQIAREILYRFKLISPNEVKPPNPIETRVEFNTGEDDHGEY